MIRRISRFLASGILLLLAATVVATAGGSTEQTSGSEQSRTGSPGKVALLSVMVSILPQQYLVQQIGGDEVRVGVMVPPGHEPHTYEPTPRQVSEISHAAVYFRIGMPFEVAILSKIEANLPDLTVVDTRIGVTLRSIDGKDRLTVTANSSVADGYDPHIWLGPSELAIQMKNIRDALIAKEPDRRAYFDSNYARLLGRLHTVEASLAKTLGPLRGSSILVFHPAFGYFTDTYGISQLAIETNGKEPGPRGIQDIIGRARDLHVRAVFVEPDFSETTASRIAEALGVQMLVINPLAPDVLSNLEQMATTIRKGVSAIPGSGALSACRLSGRLL